MKGRVSPCAGPSQVIAGFLPLLPALGYKRNVADRLRVLLSAYACAPHRGSEHEVGWQWALHMARLHDVTVLTRTKHRRAIEEELARLPSDQPRPKFVYHEAPSWILSLHRTLKITRIYYVFWQRSAQKIIAAMQAQTPFHLMHHVAFAGFRYRTAIWHHRVPTVWGPVGGMESIPGELLPWRHPVELLNELGRNAGNLLMSMGFHVLYYRAALSSVILVSNRETEHAFSELGISTTLMPTIGIEPAEIPASRPPSPGPRPLKLVYVGKVILLKGIDLALEALSRADGDTTLTVVGQGPFLKRAVRMAKELGLEKRVFFRGAVPRSAIWAVYAEHDALILPTLHDSGSFTVLEALSSQRPVICLDCGGPALSVAEGCGQKVPLGKRHEVIEELAQAIRNYAENRGLLVQQGEKAKSSVFARYAWAHKAAEMSRVYQKAILLPVRGSSRFRQRNFLLGLALLLGISGASFFSLEELKDKARLVADREVAALSAIGLATSSMNQSLLAVLKGLSAGKGEDAQRLFDQADIFSAATLGHLEAYRGVTRENRPLSLFTELLKKRSSYIDLRNNVESLAKNGRIAEAREVADQSLLRSFEEYKGVADQLLALNVAEAARLSRDAERTAFWAQILVAVSSALLLGMGFVLGFFK